MEEYQKRVIEEKAALDEKIKKLEAFLSLPESHMSLYVSEMEKARLNSQYDTMVKYSNILNQRIINFE